MCMKEAACSAKHKHRLGTVHTTPPAFLPTCSAQLPARLPASPAPAPQQAATGQQETHTVSSCMWAYIRGMRAVATCACAQPNKLREGLNLLESLACLTQLQLCRSHVVVMVTTPPATGPRTLYLLQLPLPLRGCPGLLMLHLLVLQLSSARLHSRSEMPPCMTV